MGLADLSHSASDHSWVLVLFVDRAVLGFAYASNPQKTDFVDEPFLHADLQLVGLWFMALGVMQLKRVTHDSHTHMRSPWDGGDKSRIGLVSEFTTLGLRHDGPGTPIFYKDQGVFTLFPKDCGPRTATRNEEAHTYNEK